MNFNLNYENINIVLVETKNPLNIGSTARVMDNLGFKNLSVVSSHTIDLEKTKITAGWADQVVNEIKFYDTLKECILEQSIIVGFSSKTGKNISPAYNWHNLSKNIFNLSHSQTISLVFGPEDNGLSREHLSLVTDVAYIDTNKNNPSLNLSHAVAIALYDLISTEETAKNEDELDIIKTELANFKELENLQSLIDKLCYQNGFYNDNTPRDLPRSIFNIFKRARLKKREVAILAGVFGKSIKI